MKIGIFDSGIGGLSVLKSIVKAKLFHEIIYYGDTARVPYGTKDKDTIIKFSLEAIDFFNKHDIDILIVACNTVSAYALNSMSKNTKYPVIGVIEPGVLALSNKIKDKNKNILIIATKATIESGVYEKKLINLGYKNIQSLQTGLFVPMIEEGITSGDILDSTLNFYFKNLMMPDAIILGCTHFPLIQNEIKKYFDNKPVLIHSGDAIVEYLIKNHKIKIEKKDSNIQYFASSNKRFIEETANKWLNKE